VWGIKCSWDFLLILKIEKLTYPNKLKTKKNEISTLCVSHFWAYVYKYFFITWIFFASSQVFWENLKNFRCFHSTTFIISTVVFYSYYFVSNNYVELYLSTSICWDIWYSLYCLLGWCFVLTLLGYGQVYLNKPSLWLKRINEAIYPFYILHQTVIVIFGYYIIQLDSNIAVKMILLLISSFSAILLLYRFLVYPFKITRALFGMKNINE